MQSGVASAEQYGDGNTWQIGGSRFGLYDASLMNGAYGSGGTTSPAAYATPSIPPIYSDTTNSGQFGQQVPQAASQPFNPIHSPLPLVAVGLIVAVVALHWLHWREREEKK